MPEAESLALSEKEVQLVGTLIHVGIDRDVNEVSGSHVLGYIGGVHDSLLVPVVTEITRKASHSYYFRVNSGQDFDNGSLSILDLVGS